MSESLETKSIKSFGWKLAQQTCTLGVTFVIQIIMARILSPADFGIVAITTVFMTLANTIIDTSFSSAVIQRACIDDELLSSIFYTNFALSIVVYFILFIIASPIASFYHNDILNPILRVQGVRVILSAFYSIQDALLNRRMQFKKIFFAYLIGALIQGFIGIVMALMGYGVWALVISTLISYGVSGLFITFFASWHPNLFFSIKIVKPALSFSSKVLVVNITRKLFYNVRKIAIGKIYGSNVLGLFDKGFQFPSTAMTVVDGSLAQVAFTSLSKLQDNKERLSSAVRKYIQLITFFTTPMMLGMAMIAKPMVIVLLTVKWIESVPFLQIVCCTNLFLPLLVNTAGFNALGKSNVSMWLNIGRFLLSVILLICCIPFSAEVMVFSGFVSNLFFHLAVGYEASREFGYRIKEQLHDFLQPFIPSIPMCLSIYVISLLPIGNFGTLILEILTGVITYFTFAWITNNQSLRYCFAIANNTIRKI